MSSSDEPTTLNPDEEARGFFLKKAYLIYKVRISPEHVVKWVMPRTPPPDEIRLKGIGVTRLEPGQATYAPRVRAKREVLERFLSLNTRQRGEVVEAGLRALGLWGVKDA